MVAGHTEPTIRSGETISQIVQAACEFNASALLFNCSEAEITEAAIRAAIALDPDLPIGVYAHAFVPKTKKLAANIGLCDIRDDLTPDTYLTFAQRWIDTGATIVGGCCGIGTSHIAELAATFKPANVPA